MGVNNNRCVFWTFYSNEQDKELLHHCEQSRLSSSTRHLQALRSDPSICFFLPLAVCAECPMSFLDGEEVREVQVSEGERLRERGSPRPGEEGRGDFQALRLPDHASVVHEPDRSVGRSIGRSVGHDLEARAVACSIVHLPVEWLVSQSGLFISERPGATLIYGSWSTFNGSACSKFRVPKFCKSWLF